ncbi:uncharacterized mitochondrial protein AtMg00810-like [Humulus lupulus]|uniref:uncharacterized mitochondrial protein AtMg00810-like n=1 Tax=Humulus lupulus TaxID=3486 RepID=UPI002B409989|nr:uncharacterized mitochondrial protein AtMg00810-like [Humulus lupulus]
MQGQIDHILFIKHSETGKIAVLIVYVDNIIATGNHTEEMILIKEMLAKDFEVKNLGGFGYFLGMEFATSKLGNSVSQRKYTLDLLNETGMHGSKPSRTSIELGDKKKMFEGSPIDKGRIMRYLKQTPGKGLFFKKTTERKIEVLTDADWAGSVNDRKSTSGYCTIV